ncbi:hypothetical protein [uncultured Dokdonia sp.]|uniref:hypothetical protein n=1 Tax=uncultured Dokdonia sp. TaxID=575653 RepID=UPI0026058CBF|nr:hypothetical protein [uncultured Dokdonia sp.]
MKNLFKYLTISLLAISVSCSSDDDSSNDSILVDGETYLLTSFETETSFDLDGDGDASNDLLIETGCLQNNRLIFSTDNTATAVNETFLDIYVSEDASGNIVQLVECDIDNESIQLTFSQNGNTVNIVDAGETLSGVVSGNTLVFTLNDGFVGEFLNEDGSDGTFELEETIVLTYTRQ